MTWHHASSAPVLALGPAHRLRPERVLGPAALAGGGPSVAASAPVHGTLGAGALDDAVAGQAAPARGGGRTHVAVGHAPAAAGK